jgi:hypothetical protein
VTGAVDPLELTAYHKAGHAVACGSDEEIQVYVEWLRLRTAVLLANPAHGPASTRSRAAPYQLAAERHTSIGRTSGFSPD